MAATANAASIAGKIAGSSTVWFTALVTAAQEALNHNGAAVPPIVVAAAVLAYAIKEGASKLAAAKAGAP